MDRLSSSASTAPSIDDCWKERIEVPSNAFELHHSLQYTPFYCIPKAIMLETGEVIYEKVYASPRLPPKISLKHDWMKELGSEVARLPEGELAQLSKSLQSSQPNPNPDHDRTVKLVVCPQRGAAPLSGNRNTFFREEAVRHDRTEKLVVCRDENHERPTFVCSEQTTHPRFSRVGQNLILEDEINLDRTEKPVVCPQAGAHQTRFSRDSTNFNVEDETNHDRTGKPAVCRDANHERSMINEVDIDFRILGLPHSGVKQADNYRVRELVKRSRTTFTDKLFNEINNNTKPTTRSVRRQRRWFRTWAT